MTLRSRFFAMTYDRQMAKVEKAGFRDLRQGLLAGAGIDPTLLNQASRTEFTTHPGGVRVKVTMLVDRTTLRGQMDAGG